MPQEFDWAAVVDYARRHPAEPPRTQYELPGVTEEMHLNVPVAVVPLWHAVVTARLAFPVSDHDSLKLAQQRLDAALAEVEAIYPLDPGGIFIQVAYGLPYFRDRIPGKLTDEYMPRSVMPGTEGQWAVIDSIRFPEGSRRHRPGGLRGLLPLQKRLPGAHRERDRRPVPARRTVPAARAYLGDLFTVTAIRRGFTSSHVHGLAQGNLASFETIPGYTDLIPDSYFAGGTAMHLSHIAIKLGEWYAYPPRQRLHRMFHPRRTEGPEVLSPDQAPATASFEPDRDADAEQHGLVGHNEQMQFLSRVKEETTTAYGQKLERGTVFFLRQDFDTVEDPFGFSVHEEISIRPRVGVHFIGFGPSSQHFEKMRLEMDGVEHQQRYGLPEENTGFTKMLVTTHRQNFLLPPRAHRSMPLAEML